MRDRDYNAFFADVYGRLADTLRLPRELCDSQKPMRTQTSWAAQAIRLERARQLARELYIEKHISPRINQAFLCLYKRERLRLLHAEGPATEKEIYVPRRD